MTKTIDEKLAVMRAWLEGKPIESFYDGRWNPANFAWSWGKDNDYRIAREPKEYTIYMNLFTNGAMKAFQYSKDAEREAQGYEEHHIAIAHPVTFTV